MAEHHIANIAEKNDITKPIITVMCVTYNHEKFIADALDSILAQERSFEIKIFIADDCSMDGTPEIIEKYAKENPGVIVPFFHTENRGAEKNLIEMCRAAESKYIAICDGDDYWTDPQKLQIQYEYMEANPSMRACFHDAEIVIQDQRNWFLAKDYSYTSDGRLLWCGGDKRFSKKPVYSIKDYIPCGFIHSSTMFFRWDYTLRIPDWFFRHILGDYTIWVLQVGLGSFGYVDRVMSTYRRHGGGSYDFTSRSEFWRKTKQDWILIDDDVRAYLRDIGASQDVLDVVDSRQKDDLTKLLKAELRLSGPMGVLSVAKNNQNTIYYHSGISFPKVKTWFSWRRYLYRIDSSLSFGYRRFIKRLKWSIRRFLEGKDRFPEE